MNATTNGRRVYGVAELADAVVVAITQGWGDGERTIVRRRAAEVCRALVALAAAVGRAVAHMRAGGGVMHTEFVPATAAGAGEVREVHPGAYPADVCDGPAMPTVIPPAGDPDPVPVPECVVSLNGEVYVGLATAGGVVAPESVRVDVCGWGLELSGPAAEVSTVVGSLVALAGRPVADPPAVESEPARVDDRPAEASVASVAADQTPTVETAAEVATVETAEPIPTRKPRSRKPRAKVMTGAARETVAPTVPTTPPADPPAPVSLTDIRPTPPARLCENISTTRFSPVPTVASGWATDSKVLVRLTDAERDATLTQLRAKGYGDDGRPIPVATMLPRPSAVEYSREGFVLVARFVDDEGRHVGRLERPDGSVEHVDLKAWRTLTRHTAGCGVYGVKGRTAFLLAVETRPDHTPGEVRGAVMALVLTDAEVAALVPYTPPARPAGKRATAAAA